MKLLLNIIKCILPVFFAMIFASCDLLDNDSQGGTGVGDVEFVMNSETDFNVNPQGESVKIEFSSSASWKLTLDTSSSTEWISVNRTAGQKGDSQVTVEVQANYSGQARSATLTISADEVSQVITVSQDAIPEKDIQEFSILSEEAYISYVGGIVEVNIVHTAPYELKVTDEWISEYETKASGFLVTHKFLVEANPGWKERVANVAFCTDRMCIPFAIIQEADPNAVEPEDPADRVWEGVIEEGWETKEFLHRPVAMRFTADWCGYCPMMATALDDAKEKLGGNLEVMSLHCSGGLQYSPLTSLERQYMIAGYPTGIIDGMTEVGNYSTTSYTTSAALEAISFTESNFSTNTSISWVSTLQDRKVKASLSVYLKEPGKYKITVFAVEDNIRGYQNGAGSSYIHNGVPRHVFSSVTGDEYVASSENEVATIAYSGKMPKACNLENMRLVVYVQRSMEENSVLATGNYGGYFIDNSATAKLGESHSIDFVPSSDTEDMNQ